MLKLSSMYILTNITEQDDESVEYEQCYNDDKELFLINSEEVTRWEFWTYNGNVGVINKVQSSAAPGSATTANGIEIRSDCADTARIVAIYFALWPNWENKLRFSKNLLLNLKIETGRNCASGNGILQCCASLILACQSKATNSNSPVLRNFESRRKSSMGFYCNKNSITGQICGIYWWRKRKSCISMQIWVASVYTTAASPTVVPVKRVVQKLRTPFVHFCLSIFTVAKLFQFHGTQAFILKTWAPPCKRTIQSCQARKSFQCQ